MAAAKLILKGLASLYHGSSKSGLKNLKPSSESGELGKGISLTPSKERAEDYAINPGGYRSEEISSDIPTVYEVSPNEIKNPLIFRQDNTESSPAIELLEKLGTPSEKASSIVEKAYEEKGGLTTEITRIAKQKGHDSIAWFNNDGSLREILKFDSTKINKADAADVMDVPLPKILKNDELLEKYQKIWRSENELSNKQKQIDSVAEAAEKLEAGEITGKEYRNIVKRDLPIKPIVDMVDVPSEFEIVGALDKNKVKKGIINTTKFLKDNEKVALRLDIPAYDNYDTWVVSFHDGKKMGGQSIGYGKTAVINNVDFKSASKGALKIAKTTKRDGKAKSPIARMYGNYKNIDDNITAQRAERILANRKGDKYIDPEDGSEWSQVGMNPYRASYFVDKLTGSPLKSADEVIQVGPLVFAKNAKALKPSDFKKDKKTLTITTKTGKKIPFKKGGMVARNPYDYEPRGI